MINSLLILKPDGVSRGLKREFETFLINNGVRILDMQIHCGSLYQIELLYEEHKEKEFYDDLINMMREDYFITYMVNSQFYDVSGIRDIALRFRDKHGLNATENTVHASDNEDKAERELTIFKFKI